VKFNERFRKFAQNLSEKQNKSPVLQTKRNVSPPFRKSNLDTGNLRYYQMYGVCVFLSCIKIYQKILSPDHDPKLQPLFWGILEYV